MSHFFAYMARLKLIKRWSLMRNVMPENTQEHSLQVAMVAHALAEIKNNLYGGSLDVAKTLALSLYHDASEAVTGDLPTPVKYYNDDIKKSYKAIESASQERLLSLLPPELQKIYQPLLLPELSANSEELEIVKIADKICAYLHCLEEENSGNKEFTDAKKSVAKAIKKYETRPEVKYFIEKFLPSFSLTLDVMN